MLATKVRGQRVRVGVSFKRLARLGGGKELWYCDWKEKTKTKNVNASLDALYMTLSDIS